MSEEETKLAKIEQGMSKIMITKWTANVILLIMALVWAIISIYKWKMQPVSPNFIWLGVVLAFGDVAPAILNALPKKQ